MGQKSIEEFKKDINERFVLASEMLGKIKSENGRTYKNMKNTLNELSLMSSDEKTTFEALRKKMQTLEEQVAQYIREQRFIIGYSIEGAEDYRKNNELLSSVFEGNRKKNVIKASNILLQATNSWINELDSNYPDIKKRERELQEKELAEAKNKEAEKLLKYVNTIHAFDKEFAEVFVPDEKSNNPLYKQASVSARKLMNRMHREDPKLDEHLFIKDDLKVTRKHLEKYIWDVREKHGTGKSEKYTNPVFEEDILETLGKMTDQEEKKNFKSAVDMMESIRKCNIGIDRAQGVPTLPKSLSDFSIATVESLSNLKNKQKFWGKESSNSVEFNNFTNSYNNAIKVMGNKNMPISEYREAIRKMEEASLIYVRAKRVQKGYDTKNIPDTQIDKLMLGRSKDGNGPSIFGKQGRDRYDFAISTLIATAQMRMALDAYEEKLENEAKDEKRAEEYANRRKNFMAHKEKLDKELKAFENGEKKPNANVEEVSKQVEKVKNLSNLMAEKFNKGMDIWSNELTEYNDAIKALKGLEKKQEKIKDTVEVVKNEIEDISLNTQDEFIK